MLDAEAALRRLAESLGWPPGVVEVCIYLRRTYPRWHVWWCVRGDLTAPEQGYRASLQTSGYRSELADPTAAGLRARIEWVEQELPPGA